MGFLRTFDSPFIIIGAGGHGAGVAEVLVASGAEIEAFVDEGKVGEGSRLGIPILGKIPDDYISAGRPLALGVGDNRQRQQLFDSLVTTYGAKRTQFPSVAHPSASVSHFASVGIGTFAFQGAVVGPGAKIGNFCVLATGATATHDAVMGDYSFLAVHAVLGAASFGERSFLGLGSVVHQGCEIGHDVVIGAQSFVRTDLPSGVVAHGIPAEVRRSRSLGEPYLAKPEVDGQVDLVAEGVNGDA